ncbi:hypothetical protein L1987_78334 [Smallanthus sonchifolius]|uniref:Uncharacterized protein n=1 Tax=Smallanthus sonchifolius TaxID=185202 RepID=A0ACB8ZCJ9_9ASTR|nr:hypothetical protein L1987_78334 [Smallanthus sonchifolius]
MAENENWLDTSSSNDEIDVTNFCLMASNCTSSESSNDSTSKVSFSNSRVNKLVTKLTKDFHELDNEFELEKQKSSQSIEKEPRNSGQGIGFTRGSGSSLQTKFIKASEGVNIELKSKISDSLVITRETSRKYG